MVEKPDQRRKIEACPDDLALVKNAVAEPLNDAAVSDSYLRGAYACLRCYRLLERIVEGLIQLQLWTYLQFVKSFREQIIAKDLLLRLPVGRVTKISLASKKCFTADSCAYATANSQEMYLLHVLRLELSILPRNAIKPLEVTWHYVNCNLIGSAGISVGINNKWPVVLLVLLPRHNTVRRSTSGLRD